MKNNMNQQGDVCVKVSLVQCEDYEYNRVKASILKQIEHLGGLAPYINKNDRVLLKANLVMKKTPEEATTTHPHVMKALCEILLEYGAFVVIGDSPGGPFTHGMLSGIYRASGMEAIAHETGATLNQNTNSFFIENKKGLLLKRLLVTDMLNDVDKVISVSKLKTHGMMTLTGAVKNMFGVVPGIKKAEYHLNMPEQDNFANALIDICLAANPVLSFMDGIVAMEGEGPSAGNPKKMGVLLASASPFHLDKVAATIIGLPFSQVFTIEQSIKRNLCNNSLSDIQMLGDPVEHFICHDFVIPNTRSLFFDTTKWPAFLSTFVANHIKPKPVFHEETCVGCGICAENCPAKCITLTTKDHKPTVKLASCIRCYCCQELCPKKAVTIYRPRFLRLFTKN